MRKANERYYSSKGRRIYSDFSTFAQGKSLARCNAAEFCRDFARHAAPIVVCEYGIGKGDFARTFLDEVKKRSRRLYLRTRYYLFDFSEKMLHDARKNLKAHRSICIFGKFDAARDSPDLRFDYCRINELLTDLPAGFYMRNGGRTFALHPGRGAAFSTREAASPSPAITAFLSRIDEGRAIPFNFAAEKFLLSLCALGKPHSRMDVFDYGFYSADDVFLLPKEEWNRLLVRNYGGQLTTDLNFLQLLSSLASCSVPSKIEKQKQYCECVLRRRLAIRHTKAGLDYVVSRAGNPIEEDDGFYHLRAGK